MPLLASPLSRLGRLPSSSMRLGLRPCFSSPARLCRLPFSSRSLFQPAPFSSSSLFQPAPFSSSSSSAPPSSAWLLAVAAPLAVYATDDQQTVRPVITQQPSPRSSRGYQLPLNPELAAQISKGSVLGCLLGLFISTFSRTLVLLLGVAFTVQNLASRMGIDLARHLKLKERAAPSRILAVLAENSIFNLAFGLTFTLSAFMRF